MAIDAATIEAHERILDDMLARGLLIIRSALEAPAQEGLRRRAPRRGRRPAAE